MPLAQILEEIKTLSDADLKDLRHLVRIEELRRSGNVLSGEETHLFQIINQPLAHAERFKALSQKWQDVGISEEERAELLAIVIEREGQNVERVEAVTRLSELRGVPFKALWRQILGEVPTPIVPRN